MDCVISISQEQSRKSALPGILPLLVRRRAYDTLVLRRFAEVVPPYGSLRTSRRINVNRIVMNLMALPCMVSAQLFGGTIYSNTTTDTLDTLAYGANGFTQIGDQVHLAGVDRLATLATVQFFNLGLAGTFDATLRFFNVGAPVGSQIGSAFVLTGIAAPANDIFNVAFTLPNLLVPDELIFTVSVGGSSAGVNIIGLDMFEPPTVGSSDNTFAIANNGANFLQTGTANENVFFELQATSVPEPATAGVAGSALLALALLRRRFSNPSRSSVTVAPYEIS